jgi:hypothetical protein
MTGRNLRRRLGCWLPLALLLVIATWIMLVLLNNERRNNLGKIEYARLCREDALLDNVNKERWNKLRRDVESGNVDSRDLRIAVPRYYGPNDQYQDTLGPLVALGDSGRLFRQSMFVYKRDSKIVTISNIIVIDNQLFGIYGLPFISRSCYSDLKSFDQIINHNQY